MTISISSSSNVLAVLAQVATNTAQSGVNQQVTEIDTQIQNRLNAQIAGLQPPSDDAASNAISAQLSSLQSQQSTITKLQPEYGTNASILSQLQTQLANLQTAAANGDSADFDSALSQANTYLSDLTATSAPAPFQPDGVAGLLGTGLGIESSAQYNLSTSSGQAAAEAAVTSAQNTVGQIFSITTSNQVLAGSLNTSLNDEINQIQTVQQQQQSSDQTATQNEINQLTQRAQEQEHVIELSLGNTTELANAIYNAVTPVTTVSSPLAVLEDQVGATASSSTAASNASPAILDLFA